MVIISSILLKKMRTSKQKNKHEVELLYRPPKDWRNKIKKAPKIWSFQPGAQDWIRTSTPFPALPPQGSASTNFATWASKSNHLKLNAALQIRVANLFYFFNTMRKVVPLPGSEFFTVRLPLWY